MYISDCDNLNRNIVNLTTKHTVTRLPISPSLSPPTPSNNKKRKALPLPPFSPGELGKLATHFSEELAHSGWTTFFHQCRHTSSVNPNLSSVPHTMAPYLARLARLGVPAPSAASPWTTCQKDLAFQRGPHPSAARQFASFLLEDMYDYVKMGYWVVLPYQSVRHLPHLKLAPAGVVPQRER